MDEVNDAIIRRVRVIPFTSKFVDEATFETLESEEIKTNNVFLGNTFYKTDEFKGQYKQALLMILFKKFEDFKNNKFQLTKPPKECTQACTEYLSMSDDIYDWFINIYEPTDDKTSFLYYDEIFSNFTSSQYYENLSKKEKRENNMKKFTMKLEKCSFLTKNLKKRSTMYNAIKHTKPYIIGFKLPEMEEEPDVKSDLDI